MTVKVVAKDQMLSQVGTTFPPGEWVTLHQRRIDAFADCTEDHQFIHVDREQAARTPFGGTIAHGFLTLSLLVKLCEGQGVYPDGMVMGINYGFDRVRFLAPVRAGKRVRVRSAIVDVTRKGDDRFLIKQAVTVEIEGEQTPALVADWLSMLVCGRGASAGESAG